MKKPWIKLLLVFAILWIAWSMWDRAQLRPVDESNHDRIEVAIQEGSTLRSIAELLTEKNVIRSKSAFERYVKRERAASSLQAGSFVLQKSMTAEEILGVLAGAKGEQKTVTIPEGFTVSDIDALLTSEGLIDEGEILACAKACDFSTFAFLPTVANLAERGGRLEGYLFPDTYFVSASSFTPQSFLERMLETFQEKVIDPHQKKIAESGHSLHQVVTMASLIEEETITNDERAVVSGILWKRLREGMRLDVDAALRYILSKPSSAITQADLELDSPYNLRKKGGLPPGPIANPGLKSIEAALKPEESPYYYYLHDSQGNIRYAKTNQEQNENRAKYLP